MPTEHVGALGSLILQVITAVIASLAAYFGARSTAEIAKMQVWVLELLRSYVTKEDCEKLHREHSGEFKTYNLYPPVKKPGPGS